MGITIIKKQIMTAIEERSFCECGGEMISSRFGRTRFKTEWLHRCKLCDHEEWLHKNYPAIVHVPKDS